MKRFSLLLIITVLFSCMPEENLPIRDMGTAPTYFIECYCKPGESFSLTATNVLSVTADLVADFLEDMNVTLTAGENIELSYALHTRPGSTAIYNYGSKKRFNKTGINTLHLNITTEKKEQISGQTNIPDDIEIHSYNIEEDAATVSFYTSKDTDQNYYIYTLELEHADTVLKKETYYLDHSRYGNGHLVEKSVTTPLLKMAKRVIFNLQRVTKENFDYQLSLSGANSANQSSMTTPVPIKGNLNGALGIFTCYTEDHKIIDCK